MGVNNLAEIVPVRETALNMYVAMKKPRFGLIAQQLGVSKGEVEQWCKSEDWRLKRIAYRATRTETLIAEVGDTTRCKLETLKVLHRVHVEVRQRLDKDSVLRTNKDIAYLVRLLKQISCLESDLKRSLQL